MKKSRKSSASKWFLKNIEKIKSNEIPQYALDSLCLYQDEDLFELACQMVDFMFFVKITETRGGYLPSSLEGKPYVDRKTRRMAEMSEFNTFIKNYKEKHFPCFGNVNEMIDFMITKVSVVLSILVLMNLKEVVVQSSFELWNVVEKLGSFVVMEKEENVLACNDNLSTPPKQKPYKGLLLDQIGQRETSMKESIDQAISAKDFKAAYALIKNKRIIVERLFGDATL